MRKISWIVMCCLLPLIAASVAYAVRVDGRVVNDDGVPQTEVKVEFFGSKHYSAWTDDNGNFSIANVAEGTYEVKVFGDKMQTFDEVKVDSRGMHPNILAVDW